MVNQPHVGEHGQMVTVVPVVVVPEGDHILSIRSIENQAANRDKAMTELAVSVKKNARYRLLNVDGELALVILEHGQFDD